MATIHSAYACLLLFLALHIISPLPLPIAIARKLSSKPGYQTFYLDGTTDKLRAELLSKSPSTDNLWTMEVVHRDTLLLTHVTNATLRFAEALSQRLERDEARVKAIAQTLKVAEVGENTAEWEPESKKGGGMSQEEFSSPIVSGISEGSGEYFTRFGVGTPPKEAYFVMDTGSDLSWTQCEPCGSCYKQSDPLFNPSQSSSYDPVTCTAPLCSQLTIRGCHGTQCLYQVSYGDGSFTVGNFAVETLTFGGNQAERVALGCGHDNEGLFVGASGLLGLGGGRLSFPSQIKQKFSYCLADRFSSGSSALVVGPGSTPPGSLFTPLLKNPYLSTFYYVELEGISVGGALLSISPSEFSLQSSGNGGVIVDSGTSITRLVKPAYAALRDAFAAGASNLPSAGSFSLFDTCYALGGMSSVDVPTVDLHLAGGTKLSLPASNYLVAVDTGGTYCFGFAGTNADFSIIGNMQQQGYRVSFDARAGRVGFAENQC